MLRTALIAVLLLTVAAPAAGAGQGLDKMVDVNFLETKLTVALRYLATRLSRRSLVVLFKELIGTEPSRRLLGVLGSLTPRHLPLVVTQRNRAIEELAAKVPQGEQEAFQISVAQDIRRDKVSAIRYLAARGSLVLDVEPEDLSVAAVNKYLEIKARGRL